MTRPGPRSRWLLLPMILVVIAVAGCGAGSGDREARRRLDAVADGISREATQHWRSDTDPSWLAVWAANDSASGSDDEATVSVRPLSWRRVGGRGELDARIEVRVPPHAAVTFGDRSRPAGHAVRCVRIDTDESVRSISCRGQTPPGLPTPPTVPDLDAQTDMIKSALRQPTIDAARDHARRHAGPFTVRADIVDGSWVLVLTRSRNYACLAGVRSPDGSVSMVVPERRVMRPGEGGCDPYAILHPPDTH
ncbi:hypothetical protein [Microlunatus soli]|uniref:hypothetical protein n=1 Tax=Microlunatus soli TaxID=630515 RepID=UPI0012F78008|nr:hypothetical protein [Microlunatus soli]